MWNFTDFPEWNRNKNATFSQYYQHSLAVAASYILSYLFIFILCMIGNGLVCLIVLKNKRMRTVTNLFILNLAISDLLVGIFCVPTTLVDNLITGWPFSNAVCKMSGLVQGMSVSASVFTLVAIAVDRFRCIVYPFKPKLTLPEAVITIVIIWVLAVAIMCPSAVMLMVSQMEDHYIIYDSDYNQTFPMYSCYEDWPDTEMRKIYTTVLFAHIYLAPLTLITLMYSRIGVKLYSSSMPVSEHTAVNSSHPEGRNVVSRKKIKIIKMLIVVALLFMVSWLPLWTLMLLTDYANLSTDQLNLMTSYIFPFAHWLAFSNSSINPIIYGYFNENFKRGFQAAFKFQCCYEEMDHQETYGEKSRVSTGNVGSFGVRNKVYTDGDSSNSTIQKKDKRNISGDRAVLTNRHGLNIEDIDHIEPLATGVCQAWEV